MLTSGGCTVCPESLVQFQRNFQVVLIFNIQRREGWMVNPFGKLIVDMVYGHLFLFGMSPT